ncbi:hypothetical protein [Bdellovibrio sp. HCB-110]|uniref:hypothetical protein n=1 Tax=Bdellovibrio sp. HCB-110 TaxID=3391182 RepID=UPI0039B4E4C8
MSLTKLRTLLLLPICLFVSLPIFAGPWISSGGDLLGDARNPWFVINTPKIRYCLKIDDSSFSASSNEVHASLQKALDFWHTEFQENNWRTSKSLNALPLFLPLFSEGPCDGREHLRFVLGEGALEKQQAQYVQSRKHDVVALSVRTNYDSVQLRAKGFIYVAGDKTKSLWIENVWKNPGRLSLVLAHELGHVFGVPHLSGDFAAMTGIPDRPAALNLMSESLPEAAVLKSKTGFAFAQGIMPVFNAVDNYKSCEVSQASLQWLKAPKETHCLQIVLGDNTTDTFAEVFGLDKNGKRTFLGSLKAALLERTLLNSKVEVITQAVLSQEQKVFTLPPNTQADFLVGGTQITATLNLLFYPENKGTAQSAIITLGPAEIIILGVNNNRFVDIFIKNRIHPLL